MYLYIWHNDNFILSNHTLIKSKTLNRRKSLPTWDDQQTDQDEGGEHSDESCQDEGAANRTQSEERSNKIKQLLNVWRVAEQGQAQKQNLTHAMQRKWYNIPVLDQQDAKFLSVSDVQTQGILAQSKLAARRQSASWDPVQILSYGSVPRTHRTCHILC